MSGPAGRTGHGGRFCSAHWGLQEGPPFRHQGSGLSREPAGKSRAEAARDSTGLGPVFWTSPPSTPSKTHRPLTPHQLPQTCSTPSGGPNSERAPPDTLPHAPPLSHGKPYQIPSLGAKPSLGGELGRGEAREKRRGLLLALALCSLASRATHPPQSHTSDYLMPFFVIAQSLTHVRLFGTPSIAARRASLSFLPLPLDHMQLHASRPSLIYPQACSALPFLFCLVNFSSFSTQHRCILHSETSPSSWAGAGSQHWVQLWAGASGFDPSASSVRREVPQGNDPA